MTGEKASSGRELSTGIAHARELIAAVMPDARWREIFDRLAEIALGDGPLAVEAAQLLMAYAFGMPAQEVDGEDEQF